MAFCDQVQWIRLWKVLDAAMVKHFTRLTDVVHCVSVTRDSRKHSQSIGDRSGRATLLAPSNATGLHITTGAPSTAAIDRAAAPKAQDAVAIIPRDCPNNRQPDVKKRKSHDADAIS